MYYCTNWNWNNFGEKTYLLVPSCKKEEVKLYLIWKRIVNSSNYKIHIVIAPLFFICEVVEPKLHPRYKTSFTRLKASYIEWVVHPTLEKALCCMLLKLSTNVIVTLKKNAGLFLVSPSYQGDSIIFYKGNFLQLKGVVVPHPPFDKYRELTYL